MNKKRISGLLALALCLNMVQLQAMAVEPSANDASENPPQLYEQTADTHLTEAQIRELVTYTQELINNLSEQEKLNIMSRLTPSYLPRMYDRVLLTPQWQLENGPYARSFENLSTLVDQLFPEMLKHSEPVASGPNGIVQDFKDLIGLNKDNLFAGLVYVDRLYDFTMGDTNIRDALLTKPDLYVPENPYDPLSLLIDIGSKGIYDYDPSRPTGTLTLDKSAANFNKIFQNFGGYNVLQISSLPEFLEKSRELFMPNQTLAEWFPTAGKAYVAERGFASGYPDVDTTSLYAKLVKDSPSRILPLLTVPEDSIYVISTPSAITYGLVGAYGERGEALMQRIDHAADDQIAYLDFWNRMLPDERKDSMLRNIEVYDSLSRYDPNNGPTKGRWLAQTDPMPGMQDFIMPLMMYDNHRQFDAQASESDYGSTVRFWLVRVLEERGGSTFGHELTHILEDDAWMGQPRRDGMGAESYTRGMFETYDEKNIPVLNLNLLYENRNEGIYYRNKSPQRFQTPEDLQIYMNGVMDVVNTLDYAEAEVALQWEPAQKVKWFHKFLQNPVADKSYRLDEIAALTEEEAKQLVTVHDLVDHDIVAARYGINGFQTVGKREHNSYDIVPLFTANYMAAQNDSGISGDVILRRHAHDLLAEYGYYEGMVPYISNQYKDAAQQEGTSFSDGYILQKVSGGTYTQMKDFKKAMLDRRYNNRQLLKPVTIQWDNRSIEIKDYEQLKTLLSDAMQKDLQRSDCGAVQPSIRGHETNVEKLKAAVMTAYLELTDEFRSSIYRDAEVLPPEPAVQTITAEDVSTVFGASDVKVHASTDGDGALSFAVTSGSDVVQIDPSTGMLTINKVGSATITITAEQTEAYQAASKTVTVTVVKKQHAPITKAVKHQVGTTGKQVFSLSDLLPADAGTLSYKTGAKTDPAGLVADNWGVQENNMTYTLNDVGKDGDTATLQLVISSENYEDTTLTLKVSLFGTKPTQPKPTEPKPTQPKPTQPKPTEPKPTQPKPTQPKPTEPKPTQPKPTQPKPTEPKPTQPKPTQPKPTEPKPTQPKPTEPKPTQPKPTEPVKNPFVDVSPSDYFYKPVLWAVNKGITAGVSKDRFAPEQSCTRAQIVTFLWAAAGRHDPTTTVNPFSDVHESDYYYKAVLWAVENGITAGVSEGKFAPNQVCNRAQTVTFLWAAQGKPPVDTDTSFGDVSASDYYANAVKWAAQNGVTAGVGGNKFAPSQNCSRGQIVTFLYKAVG